ncbi:MAG: polyhydroxyalkanoate synthesis regulator DNA-binding domain-containing protein [Gemmatimonadales bacterium]
MARLVKRYGGGSRKLYDTEDSRYVSLEELGDWVREGQEVRVVDSTSKADVTAQTLAQVILEGHRRGGPMLSSGFLHEIIRRGESVVSSGVEQVQEGLDRLVRASVGRMEPVNRSQADVRRLRRGLARLARSLDELEGKV